MPIGVFWMHVAGVSSDLALERISMTRAIGLAIADTSTGPAAQLAATDQADVLPSR